MAKLSAREAAAKKAGGTLNYKTGKISVPVKKTPLSTASASKPSGKVAVASNADGTVRYSDGTSSNPYASNVGETAGIVEARFNAQEKGTLQKSSKPKSSSSSPKKTNSTAAKAPTVSNLASPKPAVSQGTIQQGQGRGLVSDLLGKLGQMWGNNALSRAPDTAFLSGQQRQANLNASLGISGASAAGPSALELALAKGSTPDTPTGYGPNGETYYNNRDPSVPLLLRSDFATPGTDFSRPGSEAAYSQGVSPVAYGQQQRAAQIASSSQPSTSSTRLSSSRSPRPITGGFTPAQSAYIAPQASFQPQAQPDYTPIAQNQPGTQRQFLGNGMLSNGAFNNGQGDYGFQGTMTGDNTLDEQSLINQLLGVNTAQAAEMPQTMDFSQQTPASAFQQSFAQGGLSGANPYGTYQQPVSQVNPTNQAPQAPPRVQNPGGGQGGGVAQQYAQGATGGSPMEGYYKQQQKGYSAQEKAQKKALKELIKSIKSQYGTKQTEGTAQLEKSKQEDLLKLSGLFNFANQDPNSEQRIQYEQRANQDYAGQLTDFLSKLAAAQGQEVSQAKQGYQGKLADIAQQRNATALEIAKLQQAQQEAAQRGRGKAPASPKFQYAYDNNGQVTGTYTSDDAGNVYFNPVDTPFQAKPKSSNLIEQLFGGGVNLNGTSPY